MGGFGGFRYLPQEQMNPVLSGLTMAFGLAQQMKQQAMEQENMRMREAHEKRIANSDDLRTQMEMQRSGAKPLQPGQNSTSETMTTPATTLPGAGGMPILTIPGSSQRMQVPVDPSTVVSDANSGRRYAMPTEMEQITRAMQLKRAEGHVANENAMDLFRQKNAVTRPQDLEDSRRSIDTEIAKESRQAKAKHDEGVWTAAREQTADAEKFRQQKTLQDDRERHADARNAANNARIDRRTEANGTPKPTKITAADKERVVQQKSKALTASYKQYAADLAKAGKDQDKKNKAQERHLESNQAAQDTYEETLKSWGFPVQHVTYTPQGAITGPEPAGAAKRYTPQDDPIGLWLMK